VRRRQVFAMQSQLSLTSRQTAPIPSGAAGSEPAAVPSSPPPVSRAEEDATQAIWDAPTPKRKKLSLKRKPADG
jgi:hypothetical protein